MKEIKIELTDLCYRNCIHCSSEASISENPHFLKLDTVKKLIDESVKMDISSIVLTGGEATLYPYADLMEIITYAKSKNMNIKLYTMCHRNKENLNLLVIANALGLSEIIYSTATELVRDKTEEETLSQFFMELNAFTNLKISFHHVLTNLTIDNIDDIFEMISSLDKEKLGKVSFLRYVPHGRGDTTLIPSKSQIENFKKKVIELRKLYPNLIKLGSPHNILGIEHTNCTAASETFIVGFNGNVYPCDAMKYFEYMGLSGNINENSLEDIYNSSYFSKIRELKIYNSQFCQKCVQYDVCRGGCLGQKMICNFNKDEYTFAWYEFHARRTMNEFSSPEMMKLNAKTGLAGETGELIDCIKKLQTHNCSVEKQVSIKKIMIDEIGDILWYIAAPLSSYYGISFEEIGRFISKVDNKNIRKIDNQLIKHCALESDPDCPFRKQSFESSLDIIDESINLNDEYKIDVEWEKIDKISFALRYCESKEEIIKNSAALLLVLAKLSNLFFGISIKEIIIENIEKLKIRYPFGFDSELANQRLAIEEQYKTVEDVKQKTFGKK